MPEISRFFIKMFTHDHNPPHFHALKSKLQCTLKHNLAPTSTTTTRLQVAWILIDFLAFFVGLFRIIKDLLDKNQITACPGPSNLRKY